MIFRCIIILGRVAHVKLAFHGADTDTDSDTDTEDPREEIARIGRKDV